VLLLRHGQTSMSAERRYCGVSDVPLSPLGRRQALAAASRLAGAVDVIVTSPLRRAVETAAAVSVSPAVPVVAEPGFRETDFGLWEGCTFEDVRAKFPDELAAWLGSPSVAPPGGESFTEAAERIQAALSRILASYAGRRVLVVSHVTPIKALVAFALGAPLSSLYRMHLDLATLTAIDYYSDGPSVLRSYNDASHLTGIS